MASGDDDQKKQLSELLEFLFDPKLEVRKIALQHLKSYTGRPETRALLDPNQAVTNLSKLLSDRETIAHEAYTCLINLAQDEVFRSLLVSKGLVIRLAEFTIDPENKLAPLAAMLLSNITQQEEGSLALLMLDRPVLTGYHATKLLFFFTSSAETEKDYFGWLTNVFLNLSQTKQGREFLMSKENNFIKNLLPMLSHSNVLRRRGIAGVLRNCLFLKEEHNWLLGPEIDLLTHLVLPLIGGVDENEIQQSGLDPSTLTLSAKDRFDDKERAKMPEKFRRACLEEGKIRERDLNTRRLLVECLFLLQAQRETRELLREKALYPIVRELHKFEKDEAVSNAIHDVVEMLIRDEEPEEQPQSKEGDLQLATITP